MAKKNPFREIPRPFQRALVQTNGDLAIIQEKYNRYWLVNRKTGVVWPDTFSLKEHAAKEASSITFLHDPSAPSPTWKEKTR